MVSCINSSIVKRRWFPAFAGMTNRVIKRMQQTHFKHFLNTIITCLSVLACNQDNSTDMSAGMDQYVDIARPLPEDAAPPENQIFRYLAYEPAHMDVSIDIYHSGHSEYLYERLCMLDYNNQLIPGAAERWEVSEDGKTWTFYMWPEARWSDGNPVTAHDFEYAFKRLLDPEEASVYAFFYYDIKGARSFNQGTTNDPETVGVKAIDDRTLEIETEQPCAILPYILSYPTSAPVPRWQVEKYGKTWTVAGHGISNSAFHLESWIVGESMTFGLNPYYNGPNPARLRKVVRVFDQTETGAISTRVGLFPYENDETDVVRVQSMEIERIQKDPVLSKQLWSWDRLATVYLYFRTHRPPFDDVRVRRAFAHAIDQEAIANVVLRGMMLPAYTMLPLHYPGYVGEKYKDIQAYNPDEARRLLADAGYPGGRGFPTLELWLKRQPSTSPEGQAAQAIQQMLDETLDVKINIRNADRTTYEVNMKDWEIPLSTIMFTYDFPDPHNLLSLVWHAQPKGYGRHDWKNSRFDDLVDQAVREMNTPERMKLYDEAERILAEDAGGVFLWHVLDYELRKPWVKGFPQDKWGNYPSYNNNTSFSDIYIGKEILDKERE